MFETLSRALQLGNCQLDSTRHGLMLFNQHDLYIGRSLMCYGEWAEGEMRLFGGCLRPGDVVVDGGANIGTHAVFLARRVGPQGRVYAFEPQRTVFQMLCANAALNGLAHVHARQAALGAREGTILVPEQDFGAPGNFGALSLGEHRTGEPVPVLTIDSLSLPACRLIKLDVEGMELDALQGAEATIARLRPLLYVEVRSQEQAASIAAHLMTRQYRLWWHLTSLFNPNNHHGYDTDIWEGRSSLSLFAAPGDSGLAPVGLPELTNPADWPFVLS